jgi:hypothetical protein
MFTERIRKAVESGQGLDEPVAEAAAPMRQATEQLTRRRPFLPFRIHMTDRQLIEVRDPETAVLGQSTAVIRQRDPEHPGEWREHSMLALIHVVSLEVFAPDEPAIVMLTPQ